MSISFRQRRESFQCHHCQTNVHGDGYTNHCPACLWSRHVDRDPGDRASDCDGMMEPVGVIYEHHRFRIRHRCVRCGHERWNRAAANDDRDTLIQIAATAAKRMTGA